MEVEIIKVKDQIRTINKITLHQDSKDKTKAIKGKTIKGRGDHHPSKIKYSVIWLKTKGSNLYEQKFAEIDVFQANTHVSLKNLETQMRQLAQTLQNQSRDSFPSDTKKNPKDYMTIGAKNCKLKLKLRKTN